jgi:serine/threonine-protein kinase
MEHVAGEPLTDFCHHRQLSLEQRLHLFRKACIAVSHAHRRLLIHRDLKPSNIFAFEDDNGKPAVKLLDFGVAQSLEASTWDGRASGAGSAPKGFMTPGYASPEQLLGLPLTVSTDVYSLGVVLFQLLTRSLPFNPAGRSAPELARTILDEPAPRPSIRARERGVELHLGRVSRSAWRDLDALCNKALKADPEDRYLDVEELLADLERYFAQRPLGARRRTAAYRAGKFLRRHRQVLAAIVVGLLVLGSLLLHQMQRTAEAQGQVVVEAARAQRVQDFLLDLFADTAQAGTPQRGMEVAELLERGVLQAEALQDDAPLQAELFHVLGSIYRQIPDLEQAESLLDRALLQRRELYGQKDPRVADTQVELALLKLAQDNMVDADGLAREALVTVRAWLAKDHPQYARTLAALGEVLEQRKEPDQAKHHLLEAAELQRAHGHEVPLILTLGTLARIHYDKKETEDFDRVNQERFELIERNLGAGHPRYASSLLNAAALNFDRGRYELAERDSQRALEINRRYDPRSSDTASNLSLLAKVLISQERFDEAWIYLDQALALRKELYGPTHSRVAITLSEMGRWHLERFKLEPAREGLLARAEDCFNQSLEIFRSELGETHPWTLVGLGNLANTYYYAGQLQRAEEVHRRIVGIREQDAESDSLPLAVARINLGQALAAQEKYQEAVKPLLAAHRVLAADPEGSDSPWLSRARIELVLCYEELGDPARAEQYRDPADEPDTASRAAPETD